MSHISFSIAKASSPAVGFGAKKGQKRAKTYNSGDSLVVTYLTTNLLVHCLYIAKRTESLAFTYTTITKSINSSIFSISLFYLQ